MPKIVIVIVILALFLLDLIVKGHNNRCHMSSFGHKLTTQLIQVVFGDVFLSVLLVLPIPTKVS